ncbi:MAG: YidC/Oxa1 family membrane protein insertase [Firmicutes bacterium]|jgi:YidC/Oxa1 family membrane protein insertase|nr:YidC/Oxa1 family membrane protein insertase [Bacillota bacterium]MBQ1714853.1 YidC/Oxa1 family membrane protein insertase [Bacillota bacterium]MBQ1825150.1 YidC/Oxa1 family membrane protein insertase [Bacillota bacterium]MBQ2305825.1 YidC/Oxa1 family membrane protein insertase [Bacillota bacterium]MEE3382719.1 YidC/Oxa1 family membrane protein insertase [Anaerovoracaceae bacterium]
MRLLATPLGYLLTFLYNLVGNYGIAVLIITIIVKACLYPVYAKQMKSSMKMSKLQPKIQELQQKYGNDRETYSEKVQELYKSEGASMYGGCLPMIIQMFVIMGLFALFRNPMTYMTDENMLYAIHENFLWIPDLAQPDKWILPIAAGAATFISYSMSSSQQMQSQLAGGGNAKQGNMMSKMMKYFFPIMILWFARTYPAGLAIYWFGSQVIQIFYNLRFNKWRKKQQEEEKEEKRKKKKK